MAPEFRILCGNLQHMGSINQQARIYINPYVWHPGDGRSPGLVVLVFSRSK